MSDNFFLQHNKAVMRYILKHEMYAPNGSNYHDHLCSCPGCIPPEPDPTDEEILVWEWQELQAVPSYVERYVKVEVSE